MLEGEVEYSIYTKVAKCDGCSDKHNYESRKYRKDVITPNEQVMIDEFMKKQKTLKK